MKAAFLTMQKYDNRPPHAVGSSRIRADWVMKYCPSLVPFQNGETYDAVIYQKAYWKEHMDAYQGIKIFDICDPDWFDGRPIVDVINRVDALTVPTVALQKYLEQMTDKPVVLIPDRVDPEDHFPQKVIHTGRARSVVWFGYGHNSKVLDQTLNVIKNLKLQLAVISDRPYPEADVFERYDYETVNEKLIEHDVVIMPPYQVNIRHTFKSNNKTLTAWALKIPVAHEVPDLERFMDPYERNKEANKRYNEVMTKYHCRESGPQYLELIRQLQIEKGVK